MPDAIKTIKVYERVKLYKIGKSNEKITKIYKRQIKYKKDKADIKYIS